MRQVKGIVCALALLAAAPAAAQSAKPDANFELRRDVAGQYVALYLETTDLQEIAFQIMQPMLAQIAQAQPGLWKEKKARLTGVAVSLFAKSLHEALTGLDVEMAKAFTFDELVALRDFYSSASGRSVMKKMPGFMQEAMPAAISRAMAGMNGITEALIAEGVKPAQ